MMIATQQKTSLTISKRIGRLFSLLSFTLIIASSTVLALDEADLAADYPQRYTVVEGDTLWGIAGKFLRDPWRWPEVWQGNPQVDNPDLIYPGDVLILTYVDGQPTIRSLRTSTMNSSNTSNTNNARNTVKLSPQARKIDYADAIPAVDPAAIQAYITAPLVTDEDELENAGYIVDGVENHMLMGKYDQFYARGIDDQKADEYKVFRKGRHFIDPVSKESLGWEAEHLGDARMLQEGDPARLSLVKTHSDVSIRDRLRAVHKKQALPFFYPKAPDNVLLRGVILPTKTKVTELGPLSVVAINLGEREGIKPGDVFRVLSQPTVKKDPFTGEKYSIPEEKVGLLLVFRTFSKVSFALVTNSSRALRQGDSVVSPEAD